MTDETPRIDEAFRCADCGARWYYTRRRCPACDGDRFNAYELGTGELVAVTTVHVTPGDVRAPNPLGIARFGPVRVTAQLANETLSAGDSVVFAGAYHLREDTKGARLARPRSTD